MYFTKKSASEKRKELKKKLNTKKLLKFPGAYNPLSAKLITEISFDGIYISGAVMANDLGIPDIGITTLNEVSYRSNQIARVTDLPSIVDADTGWAVGSSGILWKTTDGGSTWSTQTSGTTRDLYGVYFLDPNTGFVIGASGTTLKTTDGGSNWTRDDITTVGDLFSIIFVSIFCYFTRRL